MWSLDNYASIRGRKYQRVIIDEAAMVRNLAEAWQQVIRPTLTDLVGDAWMLSTPLGRNFFWQCFQRGKDTTQTEWASWRMPTRTNPTIRPTEIKAMQAELPARVFRQEILAEFLSGEGAVFRSVSEATGATLCDKPAENGVYVVGCDFARQNDYSVFTVLDTAQHAVVAIDRMTHIDYQTQIWRLEYMCQIWQPHTILAEANSIGIPIIEQLQRKGLPVRPFNTTNASKQRIIDALALAFEQERIRIPDDPVLVGELLSFEMERLPSGLTRYAAPSGMHDDCVMSLALALEAAGGVGGVGGLMVF
ncbi:MAG: hypothetical protein HC876_17570 [Chloroflexaceae bacterium]|nr:hypothetical protein [Chloroflexaceae bacterium]